MIFYSLNYLGNFRHLDKMSQNFVHGLLATRIPHALIDCADLIILNARPKARRALLSALAPTGYRRSQTNADSDESKKSKQIRPVRSVFRARSPATIGSPLQKHARPFQVCTRANCKCRGK